MASLTIKTALHNSWLQANTSMQANSRGLRDVWSPVSEYVFICYVLYVTSSFNGDILINYD